MNTNNSDNASETHSNVLFFFLQWITDIFAHLPWRKKTQTFNQKMQPLHSINTHKHKCINTKRFCYMCNRWGNFSFHSVKHYRKSKRVFPKLKFSQSVWSTVTAKQQILVARIAFACFFECRKRYWHLVWVTMPEGYEYSKTTVPKILKTK